LGETNTMRTFHARPPRRTARLPVAGCLALFFVSFIAVQLLFRSPTNRRADERRTTVRTPTFVPLLPPGVPVFPPQCSEEDLATVSFQLPDTDCKNPAANGCSFSYASRCPDSLWWTEQYKTLPQPSHPTVAIFVGCNKAMDAVNALRLMSADSTYNRAKWANLLFDGQPVKPGACGQGTADDSQFEVGTSHGDQRNDKALVHCIEAMPVTAALLNRTANTLGWQNRLVVSNVAMSDEGTCYIVLPDNVYVTCFIELNELTQLIVYIL